MKPHKDYILKTKVRTEVERKDVGREGRHTVSLSRVFDL